MKVLLTGGLGFVGTTTRAAFSGHDVVVLDNLDPSSHRVRPDTTGIEWIEGDVRDPQVLDTALQGMDAVVHLAAKVGIETKYSDVPEYVSSNEYGTSVLLSAMERHQVKNLVLASSMVVYGEGKYTCPEHGDVAPAPRRRADLDSGRFEPHCHCGEILEPGLVEEDAQLDPKSAYAHTKAGQEALVRLWAREGGRAAMLRYHNIYGPHMPRDTPYSGVAAMWRSALEGGRAPLVYEDGQQRRDFVHVDDVAAANLLALETLTEREDGWVRAYNVASGDVHPILDMATMLSETLTGPAPEVTGKWRDADVRHVTASISRIEEELRYTPQVALHEGVQEFATAPLRP